MRLVVDATSLRPDRQTGVERYTEHVVRDLPPLTPGVEWVAIARDDVGARLPSNHFGKVISVSRSRWKREGLDLPTALARAKADIAFFPAFPPPIAPRLRQTRVVMTIHDATYWRYPGTLSRGARLVYKPLLEHHLRRRNIDAILCPSIAAARDVRAVVPSPIPVTGIPLGVDVPPISQRLAEVPSAADPAPEPYLLAVGTLEPRKNYGVVVEALRLLRRSGLTVPELRIVGRRGWGPEADALSRSGSGARLLGPVSEEELLRLYRFATLYVMPTLYEGFGLPLLEAMAAGCRCLVSDIPVLREVGGSTVTYVAAGDAAAWAAALRSSLGTREPAVRVRERQERARAFTWERWARHTAATLTGESCAEPSSANRR